MQSDKSLKILLAEDQDFLRHSLTEMIGLFDQIELLKAVSNGQQALDFCMHQLPDLILMDINMPQLNGIEATKQLTKQYPNLKIVMLTIFEDEHHIYDAIMAGATGYVLKDEAADAIEQAIWDAVEGGAPMSKMIARKALQLMRQGPPKKGTEVENQLSKRETEILQLLAKGNTYKEIAALLFISNGTVRKHIENIYKKLRVHSKLEAVQWANRKGL